MRASVATLIAEDITYDAIGQAIRTETEKEIMVSVVSITRGEWAIAGKLGVNPQIKLITPRFNYEGEDTIEFEGKRYGIYRTFASSDQIELYLERKASK